MQQKKKKKNSKAFFWALVVMGAVVVLYSMIFKLYRWQHYLICLGAALLAGRIVYIMAQGVDTSKEAPVQQVIPKTGDAAVDSLVEKGQDMLAQIRQENSLIPDAELTDQMNRLEDVAGRIFHTVAEQPGKAPQIRRFLDYYLPTTLKMLQGYRKMDERQVSGQEAQETRAQIRRAMDVVLKAFDKQLNALYHDDMLDLSTDIDVMETMLRQDGLVESGLKNARPQTAAAQAAASASAAATASAQAQAQARQ